MNIKIFAAVIGLTVSAAASPQNAAIVMPDFKPLEAKARECVNVSLGPWLLHSAGLFLNDKDPEDAAVKEMLNGIQSIQVRSYKFDSDSAYSRADIEAVRRQLTTPGWTSMLNVHDRDHESDVEMYMLIQNDQTQGFALIESEPRELTFVNIVGSIKMSDLPKLQKHLHIGKLMTREDVSAKWPAAAHL
jgi:hypothetical protein